MTQKSETNRSNATSELSGQVLQAFISGKRLYIEGLLTSIGLPAVDMFQVIYQGRKCYAQPVFLQDSPQHFVLNVALRTPDKVNTPFLQYSIKKPHSQKIAAFIRQKIAYLFPDFFAKLYRRAIKKHNALFSVTPFIQGKAGSSFYGLAHSKLPLPTEKDNRKIGGGDFVKISSEFLTLMIEKGGLKKTDHVLDIGCGLGRMAYALAYYLETSARYEGFDIMPALVVRAKKFISPYFSHFKFKHVNIWNSFYNPQGTEKSSSFCFPYDSLSFDFVLLTSVFSHMLAEDISHYISEIYRVLKREGTCLFSCFLLTEESKKLIKEGKSTQNLIHPFNNQCYVVSLDYPEASIGYEKEKMLELIEQAGFKIKQICLGSWCGRESYVSYQDIMIITK